MVVKDLMEDYLPKAPPDDNTMHILRAAAKSSAAGMAGAALTNPLDVLRNE